MQQNFCCIPGSFSAAKPYFSNKLPIEFPSLSLSSFSPFLSLSSPHQLMLPFSLSSFSTKPKIQLWKFMLMTCKLRSPGARCSRASCPTRRHWLMKAYWRRKLANFDQPYLSHPKFVLPNKVPTFLFRRVLSNYTLLASFGCHLWE